MGMTNLLAYTLIVLVKCAKTKLEYVKTCWMSGCCKGAELHVNSSLADRFFLTCQEYWSCVTKDIVVEEEETLKIN